VGSSAAVAVVDSSIVVAPTRASVVGVDVDGEPATEVVVRGVDPHPTTTNMTVASSATAR
jgi:hypothetical protein